jgi:hypothetical protein
MDQDEWNANNAAAHQRQAAILYNITVKVEQSIAAEWLEWTINEDAPGMLATACFFDYRVVRLLEVDDSEGPTYAIQYFATSKADYNRYVAWHKPVFEKRSADLWGERAFYFRSVMQIVK